MTHANDDSAISMALEQIIENGFEGLDTAVAILINEAIRVERSRVQLSVEVIFYTLTSPLLKSSIKFARLFRSQTQMDVGLF